MNEADTVAATGLATFVERARKAGATVHLVADVEQAARKSARLLADREAQSAVLAHDLGDWRPLVAAALAEAGVVVAETREPAIMAGIHAGVSRSSLAVAETGSVLVANNDLGERLVTMLPDYHVVMVQSESLVSTLEEAMERIAQLASGSEGELIHYVSLVTGPSRSADIEQRLTIGVHGPKELHIIVAGGVLGGATEQEG